MRLLKNQVLKIQAPKFYPEDKIWQFVDSKKAWLTKQLTYQQEFLQQKPILDTNSDQLIKAKLEQILPAKINFYANLLGLDLNELKIELIIKKYKSKWGSCKYLRKLKSNKLPNSVKLSFNLRLGYLETCVIDYVVAHELAHIYHPNHSTKFWQLVSSIYPTYTLVRQTLKQKGSLYLD